MAEQIKDPQKRIDTKELYNNLTSIDRFANLKKGTPEQFDSAMQDPAKAWRIFNAAREHKQAKVFVPDTWEAFQEGLKKKDLSQPDSQLGSENISEEESLFKPPTEEVSVEEPQIEPTNLKGTQENGYNTSLGLKEEMEYQDIREGLARQYSEEEVQELENNTDLRSAIMGGLGKERNELSGIGLSESLKEGKWMYAKPGSPYYSEKSIYWNPQRAEAENKNVFTEDPQSGVIVPAQEEKRIPEAVQATRENADVIQSVKEEVKDLPDEEKDKRIGKAIRYIFFDSFDRSIAGMTYNIASKGKEVFKMPEDYKPTKAEEILSGAFGMFFWDAWTFMLGGPVGGKVAGGAAKLVTKKAVQKRLTTEVVKKADEIAAREISKATMREAVTGKAVTEAEKIAIRKAAEREAVGLTSKWIAHGEGIARSMGASGGALGLYGAAGELMNQAYEAEGFRNLKLNQGLPILRAGAIETTIGMGLGPIGYGTGVAASKIRLGANKAIEAATEAGKKGTKEFIAGRAKELGVRTGGFMAEAGYFGTAAPAMHGEEIKPEGIWDAVTMIAALKAFRGGWTGLKQAPKAVKDWASKTTMSTAEKKFEGYDFVQRANSVKLNGDDIKQLRLDNTLEGTLEKLTTNEQIQYDILNDPNVSYMTKAKVLAIVTGKVGHAVNPGANEVRSTIDEDGRPVLEIWKDGMLVERKSYNNVKDRDFDGVETLDKMTQQNLRKVFDELPDEAREKVIEDLKKDGIDIGKAYNAQDVIASQRTAEEIKMVESLKEKINEVGGEVYKAEQKALEQAKKEQEGIQAKKAEKKAEENAKVKAEEKKQKIREIQEETKAEHEARKAAEEEAARLEKKNRPLGKKLKDFVESMFSDEEGRFEVEPKGKEGKRTEAAERKLLEQFNDFSEKELKDLKEATPEVYKELMDLRDKYKEKEPTKEFEPGDEVEFDITNPEKVKPVEEKPVEEKPVEEKPVEEKKPEIDEETQREIKRREEEIESYEFDIENNLEEINNTKSNLKEDIANVRNKMKEVRADKKLSKEEKEDKIEDLKAEIEDLRDEADSYVEQYRDEIKEYKSEKKKAERDFEKFKEKLPKVEEKPVEEKPVENKPVEDKPVEDKPVEEVKEKKPGRPAGSIRKGVITKTEEIDNTKDREPSIVEKYNYANKKDKTSKGELKEYSIEITHTKGGEPQFKLTSSTGRVIDQNSRTGKRIMDEFKEQYESKNKPEFKTQEEPPVKPKNKDVAKLQEKLETVDKKPDIIKLDWKKKQGTKNPTYVTKTPDGEMTIIKKGNEYFKLTKTDTGEVTKDGKPIMRESLVSLGTSLKGAKAKLQEGFIGEEAEGLRKKNLGIYEKMIENSEVADLKDVAKLYQNDPLMSKPQRDHLTELVKAKQEPVKDAEAKAMEEEAIKRAEELEKRLLKDRLDSKHIDEFQGHKKGDEVELQGVKGTIKAIKQNKVGDVSIQIEKPGAKMEWVKFPKGNVSPGRQRMVEGLRKLRDEGGLVSSVKGKEGKMTDGEINSAMTLVDAQAEVWSKTTGRKIDEFYDEYFGEIYKGKSKDNKNKAKGVAKWIGNKGHFGFFDGADVSTIVHEFSGHTGRRVLSDLAKVDKGFAGDLKKMEKWAGAKNGRWNKKAEEKFARGFEHYIRTGKAPVPYLENVFARLSGYLKGIYQKIAGSDIDVRPTKEVREVFDRLLGKEVEGDVLYQSPKDLPPKKKAIKMAEELFGGDNFEELGKLKTQKDKLEHIKKVLADPEKSKYMTPEQKAELNDLIAGKKQKVTNEEDFDADIENIPPPEKTPPPKKKTTPKKKITPPPKKKPGRPKGSKTKPKVEPEPEPEKEGVDYTGLSEETVKSLEESGLPEHTKGIIAKGVRKLFEGENLTPEERARKEKDEIDSILNSEWIKGKGTSEPPKEEPPKEEPPKEEPPKEEPPKEEPPKETGPIETVSPEEANKLLEDIAPNVPKDVFKKMEKGLFELHAEGKPLSRVIKRMERSVPKQSWFLKLPKEQQERVMEQFPKFIEKWLKGGNPEPEAPKEPPLTPVGETLKEFAPDIKESVFDRITKDAFEGYRNGQLTEMEVLRDALYKARKEGDYITKKKHQRAAFEEQLRKAISDRMKKQLQGEREVNEEQLVGKNKTVARTMQEAINITRDNFNKDKEIWIKKLLFDSKGAIKTSIDRMKKQFEVDPMQAARLVNSINSMSGVGAKVNHNLKKLYKDILGPVGRIMSENDQAVLGFYREMKNIVAINEMRLNKTDLPPENLLGMTVQDAKQNIKWIEEGKIEKLQGIVPAKQGKASEFLGFDPKTRKVKNWDIERIKEASDKLDKFYADQLLRLKDAGVITESDYNNIKNSRNFYNPRYYIEKIFEIGNGGKIDDPGINYLKEGSQSAILLDPQIQMKNFLSSVEGAITYNETARNLADFVAKYSPEWGMKGKLSRESMDEVYYWKALNKLNLERAEMGLESLDIPDPGSLQFKYSSNLPSGKTAVRFRDKRGRNRELWLDTQMARELTVPDKNRAAQRILSMAMGNEILKTFATRINPEFAVSNMIRDMQHMILTTGQFSGNMNEAMIEMATNIKNVAWDAMNKKGRYNEYFDELGGMDFLAGMKGMGIRGKYNNRSETWRKFMGTLEYLGGTSEIITRLALREQVINNGIKEYMKNHGGKLPPKNQQAKFMKDLKFYATQEARRYIDFNNKGYLGAWVDAMLPYYNANLQVIRGNVRAIKDPVKRRKFLTHAMVIGAYTAAIDHYNNGSFVNLEDDIREKLGLPVYDDVEKGLLSQMGAANRDDIPKYVKAGYQVMMTPWHFVNDKGEKQFLYYKFPMETVTSPVMAGGRHLNRIVEGLQDPETSMQYLEAMKQTISGVADVAMEPTVFRILGGVQSNYDSFRKRPITNVDIYGDERITWRKNRSAEFDYRTHPFFIRAGQLELPGGKQMSPARTQYAFQSLFTGKNVFADFTLDIMKNILPPLKDPMAEEPGEESLAKMRQIYWNEHKEAMPKNSPIVEQLMKQKLEEKIKDLGPYELTEDDLKKRAEKYFGRKLTGITYPQASMSANEISQKIDNREIIKSKGFKNLLRTPQTTYTDFDIWFENNDIKPEDRKKYLDTAFEYMGLRNATRVALTLHYFQGRNINEKKAEFLVSETFRDTDQETTDAMIIMNLYNMTQEAMKIKGNFTKNTYALMLEKLEEVDPVIHKVFYEATKGEKGFKNLMETVKEGEGQK